MITVVHEGDQNTFFTHQGMSLKPNNDINVNFKDDQATKASFNYRVVALQYLFQPSLHRINEPL